MRRWHEPLDRMDLRHPNGVNSRNISLSDVLNGIANRTEPFAVNEARNPAGFLALRNCARPTRCIVNQDCSKGC
jgi:hypothetical protein